MMEFAWPVSGIQDVELSPVDLAAAIRRMTLDRFHS